MMPHPAAPPSSRGLLFTARSQAGFTIVTLRGELDIASAPALRERLLGVLAARTSRLVMDLANVSFCDASGLAVLMNTGRRARLLGGDLRLAAPSVAVLAALKITGLQRQFPTFATVTAAIADSRTAEDPPPGGDRAPAPISVPAVRRVPAARRTRGPDPDSGDLRKAVTALLKQSDAWRDADPRRRLAPTLRALAHAQSRGDHAALAEVARSLLAALARHPLSHLPAVATTATELRRVVTNGSHRLSPN
jgi:anti-sigma B factor antagonist